MTELDFNEQHQKKYIQQMIKEIFKMPETVIGIPISVIGVVDALTFPKEISSYILLINGTLLLKKSLEKLTEKCELYLINLDYQIRETEEYKKTNYLYREYVKNIAVLLKKLEFENNIDTTIYIDHLIHSGTLSQNKVFTYKIDKYDYHCVPELLGANVSSGTGVCRHIAGLSSTILNELQVKSITLSVKMQEYYYPEWLQKLKKYITNHKVVGIIDANEKYIFDPTNHRYATSPGYFYKSKKLINSVSKIIKKEIMPFEEDDYVIINWLLNIINQPEFYCIDKDQRLANFQLEQEMFRFNNNPWKKITPEELEERKEIILKLFNETECEREEFYQQNKDLMTELAYMYSNLSPYSDEEKPRWVLHKK